MESLAHRSPGFCVANGMAGVMMTMRLGTEPAVSVFFPSVVGGCSITKEPDFDVFLCFSSTLLLAFLHAVL